MQQYTFYKRIPIRHIWASVGVRGNKERKINGKKEDGEKKIVPIFLSHGNFIMLFYLF